MSTAEWTRLVEAAKPKRALLEHFSYLCDSPGFEPVLKGILEEVESVEIRKGQLVVTLRGQDDAWIAGPPCAASKLSRFPKSFTKLVGRHETMSFGKRLHFGANRALDFGSYSEGDLVYQLFDGDGSNVLSPLYDSISNDTVWVYSPEHKNSAGEPALFPIIHELEDVIEPVDLNAGALFLSRLVAEAGLKISVPKPKPPRKKAARKSGLDELWTKILRRALGEDDDSPEKVTLDRVLERRISEIDCLGLRITDLSPLITLAATKRFGLEKLSLANTRVSDVSALSALKKLYALDLSGTPVRDVSPLAQVKHLTCDRCAALDPGTLASLKKLTRLSLRETSVADIAPFLKRKDLVELNLYGSRVTDAQARELQRGRKGLELDLRPDLKNPLERKLAELSRYKPEEALEAGEILWRKASAKAKKKFLGDLVTLCEAASTRFLYTNKKRFRFFHAKQERLLYIQKSGDDTELRSVKGATPAQVAKLMLDVYKRKRDYSEANLDAKSFFNVDLFVRHLATSTFHDITRKEVEKAVLRSGKFKHNRDERGMYIKPK